MRYKDAKFQLWVYNLQFLREKFEFQDLHSKLQVWKLAIGRYELAIMRKKSEWQDVNFQLRDLKMWSKDIKIWNNKFMRL